MAVHAVHVPVGGVIGTSALQQDIAGWGILTGGWRLINATYNDATRPRTFVIEVESIKTGVREQRRFELTGLDVRPPGWRVGARDVDAGSDGVCVSKVRAFGLVDRIGLGILDMGMGMGMGRQAMRGHGVGAGTPR